MMVGVAQADLELRFIQLACCRKAMEAFKLLQGFG
jgi:hypothetical protein